MGLDAGFRALLSQRFDLRRHTGQDQWGNEEYAEAESHVCFNEGITTSYGTGDEGEQQEKRTVRRGTLITDAVGAKLDDHVVIGGTTYTVTEVETARDEQGADLYQTITIEAD